MSKLNAVITEIAAEKGAKTVMVSDNIATMDIKTTGASKMCEHYEPIYNATVIDKLSAAGIKISGKTNMDEMGVGYTGKSSIFGAAVNPVNPEYSAGGAHGGSAAAVAEGMCDAALAPDTLGSLLIPAAHCGVTAMRPTYGAVSRLGVFACASSFDQVGVAAKSAGDIEEILSAVSGSDKNDATSADRTALDFSAARPVGGMKIAVLNTFSAATDAAVIAAVKSAATALKSAEADITEIPLPYLDEALKAAAILSAAEFSSNMSRFDGIEFGHRSKSAADLASVYYNSRTEGFGDSVKLNILLGAFVLSSDHFDGFYKKALAVKKLVKAEYTRLFEDFDLIICPVSEGTAPKLSDDFSLTDTIKQMLYTSFAAICGLPAAAAPFGTTENGLPVAVQIIGKQWGDIDVMSALKSLESAKEVK